MVLAILDDLLFTSKIRSAAAGAGVPVSFARSRDAALAAIREHHPALVVLDLNNPRTDPLGIVAAIAGDPDLRGIRTVGFVSHVQTELIEAARTAGITDVLARSAFSAQLPDLLGGR
ncbi:MAG: two-component system response regulator [Vicinamibacterales bacterium]